MASNAIDKGGPYVPECACLLHIPVNDSDRATATATATLLLLLLAS